MADRKYAVTDFCASHPSLPINAVVFEQYADTREYMQVTATVLLRARHWRLNSKSEGANRW